MSTRKVTHTVFDTELLDGTICEHTNKEGKKNCRYLACVGQKVCALHGGILGYAGVLKGTELRAAYLAFRASPSVMDLAGELAMQRTMISTVLAKMGNVSAKDIRASTIAAIMTMTGEVGNLVRTMSQVAVNMRDVVHIEDVKMIVDQIVAIIAESDMSENEKWKIAKAMENLTVPVQVVPIEEVAETG